MNIKGEVKKKLRKKIEAEREEAEESYNNYKGHNEHMTHFYSGKLTAFEDMLTILKKV